MDKTARGYHVARRIVRACEKARKVIASGDEVGELADDIAKDFWLLAITMDPCPLCTQKHAKPCNRVIREKCFSYGLKIWENPHYWLREAQNYLRNITEKPACLFCGGSGCEYCHERWA